MLSRDQYHFKDDLDRCIVCGTCTNFVRSTNIIVSWHRHIKSIARMNIIMAYTSFCAKKLQL